MKKLLLPLGAFFLIPFVLQAQVCEWVCHNANGGTTLVSFEGQLQLSEVLPDPEGDDTLYEFIELENISKKSVSIAGWTLEDASGRKYKIPDGSLNEKGFLALYRSQTKISLNNTDGDEVRLFDPNGKLQDELQYEDKAKEEFSFARNGDKWSWTSALTPNAANRIVLPNDPPEIETAIPDEIFANTEVTFSAEGSSDPDGDALTAVWNMAGEEKTGLTIRHAFATSGKAEVSVTISDGRGGNASESYELEVLPYDLSDDVLLNELYAKPAEGEDEFIELFNSGPRPVELAGWSLSDGSKTFALGDQTIAPNGFLVLMRVETKIALNDTGDTVSLFKVDGTEKETITFGSPERGKSYARSESGWDWADPTPGESNAQSGSVLGATVEMVEPQTDNKIQSAALRETILEKYGVYAIAVLLLGFTGFMLYRSWKEKRHEGAEGELP